MLQGSSRSCESSKVLLEGVGTILFLSHQWYCPVPLVLLLLANKHWGSQVGTGWGLAAGESCLSSPLGRIAVLVTFGVYPAK